MRVNTTEAMAYMGHLRVLEPEKLAQVPADWAQLLAQVSVGWVQALAQAQGSENQVPVQVMAVQGQALAQGRWVEVQWGLPQ